MVADGIMPGNARHAVARKLLTVMWAMFKTNTNQYIDYTTHLYFAML